MQAVRSSRQSGSNVHAMLAQIIWVHSPSMKRRCLTESNMSLSSEWHASVKIREATMTSKLWYVR